MKMLRLALAVSLPISLMACTKDPPADDTGTEADADTDSDADTDTDTDTDADGDADCDAGPDTAEYGALDAASVTFDAFSNDGNLSAILAADPGEGNTADVEITVAGAIVTASGYLPETATYQDFWVGDSAGQVYVYHWEFGESATVNPGDEVTIEVTQIKNYYGVLEITGISSLSVTSTGNTVSLVDGNAAATSFADNPNELIYSYGEITGDNGECGTGYTCFEYTDGADKTTAFRISDVKNVAVGDCMQVTAPIGTYGGADQYNIANLDWVSFY